MHARRLLNSVGPGFFSMYTRHLSDSAFSNGKASGLGFTAIKKLGEEDSSFIESLTKTMKFQPNCNVLDLKKRQVLRPRLEDIELDERDKFGQIIFISESDTTVKYGKSGISTSFGKSPHDLLDQKIIIPRNHFGVIDIPKHTPFLIDSDNNSGKFAVSTCEMEQVPNHEDNIKRYSMKVACPLSEDDAKRLNLEIQHRIYHDYSKELFNKQATSKVYKPTIYNRSSGTFMNFESEDYKKDKTTAMHYHPGERSLHIFTTKKPAGVTLNFCGVAENPDERKDTEVHLKFPENSMIVLNFPPYTHHKFHGDFVCMSVHPREGQNLIQAVGSGTLPRGFLESATVFSSTKEDKDKWDLSIPTDNAISKDRSMG